MLVASFVPVNLLNLFNKLIHWLVQWLFLGYFINMWRKVSHWIIHSNDSLTNTELTGTGASFQWLFWIFSLHRVVQIDSLISSVTLLGLLYQYVVQSESLNHSFKRFINKYRVNWNRSFISVTLLIVFTTQSCSDWFTDWLSDSSWVTLSICGAKWVTESFVQTIH